MKTLYLDCSMGAAGDMLSAALYELLPDKEAFIEEINSIGLENVHISADTVTKCGINGTHFSVKIHGHEEECGDEHHHDHHHDEEHHHHHDEEHHHHHDEEHHHHHDEEHHHHHDEEHHHHHDEEHHHHHDEEHHHHGHHHSSLKDIENIINSLKISDNVKQKAMSVYTLIAEAESSAHGKPVTDIHFHEVGTLDAVADIVTVCSLMEKLAPDKVVASPVHVGSGYVRCAHGTLPVPAPATAHILKGVPIYGGQIKGELCTPTGAALLKTFASRFGEMPLMSVSEIGYGMGKKDFEAVNCIRAMLGEETSDNDAMFELCCNIDDMTGEMISYAMEKLMTVCNDVYTVPVGMKKSRTGIMICALCKAENREKAVKLIMKHTSTIGIRERRIERYTMNREIKTEKTVFGDIRVKESTGYGVTRRKYEFDDLAKAASENDISIEEVLRQLKS